MAIHYWDNNSTSTTGGTWTGTGTTSFTDTSTTMTHYYVQKPRKILVTEPENWDEEASDAFINLVNNHTNTGWKVTLRIKGDIDIIDPDIDVRTMEQFIPLLKSKAHHHDIVKINEFFDNYKIN